MFANGQTVIQWMEKLAPKHYAMEGDPIGLQLGTLNKTVKKVLIALDVTEEVVREAARLGADLIIAHHAILYRPVRNLRTDLPAGRLYESLIKHDIAVYIAHTNLDVAEGGVNDVLADALGLQERAPLENTYAEPLFKLVVFVPEENADGVREAMFAAGAGWIGNYSHCSFNGRGVGTFLPREGTNPYLGETGKLERAEEIRIETIVPGNLRRKVVQAMIKVHPYEEVAYDLYPLENPGKAYGIGRIGKLEQPLTLEQLAERVKAAYAVPAVRLVGDRARQVTKVAVLGGSGRDYVAKAQFAGAEVLITGDIDYHTAHDALASGMAVIDAGHNIEKLLKPAVADWLGARLREAGYDTEVIASQVNTEPFQFI